MFGRRVSRKITVFPTPIEGLTVLVHPPISDPRGHLERMFCADELADSLAGKTIVQINRSLTALRGTVRGMHFQYPPHAETKYVMCLRGEAFDVAVDLRYDSPTFLHWHGVTLSPSEHKTFVIPEGFAHGFQTLTDECELLYFHTAAYTPAAEAGLNPRDPMLAIAWPRKITEISDRDDEQSGLTQEFEGVGL